MEELDCDIVHVLQNRDYSVLEKLVLHCNNFRAKLVTEFEDATKYQIECKGKRTQTVNKISELDQEIKSLKFEIDSTNLEQKIVDKKINNAIKQQDKLKQEIDDTKSKRDSLSLEVVDLQQEAEKRREHKISVWNAIRLACQAYKQHLDFRIQLINNNKEHEQIKIFFFINDDATKDKYFVHLDNCNDKWRVEQIQPMLKPEHLCEFNGIFDISKQSEISDITAFLCKLRDIFVKHYLNTK